MLAGSIEGEDKHELSLVCCRHSFFSMDSQLKQLKVAELKALLTKANIQTTAKATKADLIAKILAEPAAQDAYRAT